VTKIATGDSMVCALMSNRTIRCWGNDSLVGSYANPGPTVAGITTAVDIAMCNDAAELCALLADGTVQCVGTTNSYGELGDGTTNMSTTTPVTVKNVTHAIAITVGGHYACAIVASDGGASGQVYCWGQNANSGELGNGSVNGPDKCASSPTPNCQLTPSPVVGITNATSISAAGGLAWVCATLADGTVSCWGNDANGQLGTFVDGLGNPIGTSATPLTVPGVSTGATVGTGSTTVYSVALLSGGTVWGWGNPGFGELGGSSLTVQGPAAIAGISSVTQLSAGDSHVCAIVSGGTVDCWGSNVAAQIGQANSGPTKCLNTEPCAEAPTPVAGISNAIQVSAGLDYSCALLATGKVVCWGGNEWSQLGQGEFTGPNQCPEPFDPALMLPCSTTPVPVMDALYHP
jgi:alpha-tubulin suppressor-like RCC1 family protein